MDDGGCGTEELFVVVASLFRLPNSISLESRCTEIETGFLRRLWNVTFRRRDVIHAVAHFL